MVSGTRKTRATKQTSSKDLARSQAKTNRHASATKLHKVSRTRDDYNAKRRARHAEKRKTNQVIIDAILAPNEDGIVGFGPGARKADQMKFGTIVSLKSGGPAMVVCEIPMAAPGQTPFTISEGYVWTVLWSDATNCGQYGTFPMSALKIGSSGLGG